MCRGVACLWACGAAQGGFMKDFAAWRAGVEAEKEQEWKDLEERNLQREREEEAKRVREDQAKKKKLESIAKDVLQVRVCVCRRVRVSCRRARRTPTIPFVEVAVGVAEAGV